MTMTFEQVVEIVKELPPELQREVGDFALFLKEKRGLPRTEKPRLKWRGALRHLRDEYTSVELQHKALDWWEDEVSS
jgi:hypothetical protein